LAQRSARNFQTWKRYIDVRSMHSTVDVELRAGRAEDGGRLLVDLHERLGRLHGRVVDAGVEAELLGNGVPRQGTLPQLSGGSQSLAETIALRFTRDALACECTGSE